MNDGIQVDTSALITTAQAIEKYNQMIAAQFIDMENAVWRMRQDWNGLAYIKSIEYFDRIKHSYHDARRETLSVFTKALRNAAESYETTEERIHSSTSAFM